MRATVWQCQRAHELLFVDSQCEIEAERHYIETSGRETDSETARETDSETARETDSETARETDSEGSGRYCDTMLRQWFRCAKYHQQFSVSNKGWWRVSLTLSASHSSKSSQIILSSPWVRDGAAASPPVQFSLSSAADITNGVQNTLPSDGVFWEITRKVNQSKIYRFSM